jgi:hypothetical protein
MMKSVWCLTQNFLFPYDFTIFCVAHISLQLSCWVFSTIWRYGVSSFCVIRSTVNSRSKIPSFVANPKDRRWIVLWYSSIKSLLSHHVPLRSILIILSSYLGFPHYLFPPSKLVSKTRSHRESELFRRKKIRVWAFYLYNSWMGNRYSHKEPI